MQLRQLQYLLLNRAQLDIHPVVPDIYDITITPFTTYLVQQ